MSNHVRALHNAADRHVPALTNALIAQATARRRLVTEDLVGRDLARYPADPVELFAVITAGPVVKAAEPAQRLSAAIEAALEDGAGVAISIVADGDEKVRLATQLTIRNPFMQQAANTLTAHLVTNVTDQTRAVIRQLVGDAYRDGIPPARLAPMIRRAVGLTRGQALTLARSDLDDVALDRLAVRMSRKRAMVIARTETMRAANRGQQETWRAMARDQLIDTRSMQQRWIVTPDDRLCDVCAPMDGKTVGLSTPFESTERGALPSERVPYAGETVESPPLHPQCVPAGTLVDGPPAVGAVTRRYRGDIVTVTLANGDRLSITPNHPVLTPTGWVPAGNIKVGDDLVCGSRSQRTRTMEDNDHVQAPIEQVAGAFAVQRLGAVGPSAIEFHGDTVVGEVYVVRTDSAFQREGATAVEEPVVQQDGVRCSTFDRLTGKGSALQGRGCLPRSADSDVSGFRLGRALCVSHAPPFEAFGFRAGARGDAGFAEAVVDDGTTDPEALRESFDRHAFVVQREHVVSVDVDSFSGHVYNLETDDSWYSANGIIVHNCRCTIGAVFA